MASTLALKKGAFWHSTYALGAVPFQIGVYYLIKGEKFPDICVLVHKYLVIDNGRFSFQSIKQKLKWSFELPRDYPAQCVRFRA